MSRSPAKLGVPICGDLAGREAKADPCRRSKETAGSGRQEEAENNYLRENKGICGHSVDSRKNSDTITLTCFAYFIL